MLLLTTPRVRFWNFDPDAYKSQLMASRIAVIAGIGPGTVGGDLPIAPPGDTLTLVFDREQHWQVLSASLDTPSHC